MHIHNVSTLILTGTITLTTLAVTGCKKQESTIEVTPAEAAPQQTVTLPTEPVETHAPTPVKAAAAQGVTWEIPGDWEQVPYQGMVSLTQYALPGAAKDAGKPIMVSITPLPGTGGSVVANITRWRRQAGLPPISESDLPRIVEEVETEAGKAKLIRVCGLEGDKGKATVTVFAAIFPFQDKTWFVKLKGSPELVNDETYSFFKTFLQTAKKI